MRRQLAALLVLLTCGCSVVDPADVDALSDRIAMMPPGTQEYLIRLAMNSKAVDWLRTRPPHDQVGKLQCRYQAGGKWTEWADQEPVLTVTLLIDLLLEAGKDITYEMAKDEWESVERQARKTDLLNSLPIPGGASVECRFVWDFRYEPEKVPAKLTDPDAIEPEDIMSALIVLPAPPPGLPASQLPRLIPVLCPLGAGEGWGCPPRPDDPTGREPTNPAGDEQGDWP